MIINLISGPRNISTALMYSFAQRPDTKVIDEPFYGYYLAETGIDHPGKEDTMASQDKTPEEVLDRLKKMNEEYEIVFVKNMAHHHEVLDWSYLLDYKNFFLIRDPKQLIASFAQVITNPTMLDIGLKHEADLLDFILEKGNETPYVVDSNDVLGDPEAGLRKLCERLGIPFYESMLSWEEGAREEDGTWAKYWYKNVHNSTGFAKQKTSERPLPEHCQTLYDEALPHYQKLSSYH